jgi:hypothetical protein
MPSFHYKVNFLNDVKSLVIVHKKMEFYYIINMCEMLILFS